MKNKVLRLVAILVTLAASAVAASASFILWYQPRQPKSLKR